MPIYPTDVENKHKNLDEKRRNNYHKSKNNVYPPHYLLPCNEQPEIQKMLLAKGGSAVNKKEELQGGMQRGRKIQQ